jgi:hypothetical protein
MAVIANLELPRGGGNEKNVFLILGASLLIAIDIA